MRRASRWTERIRGILAEDAGSAPIEFVVVGLLLLVPLAYLVLSLGVVQGRTMGAEAAARHVARAVAAAPSVPVAEARAAEVLRLTAVEYDLDPAETRVALRCAPAGDACPAPGATVVVTVSTAVALPFVPPVLGLDRMARIALEESAAQKVSRLGGAS